MQPSNSTDHIALLSLMLVGLLARRLAELGQLDERTRNHMRRLVDGVRLHADNRGLDDLKVLLDNMESSVAA
jgi:hypothetical protein